MCGHGIVRVLVVRTIGSGGRKVGVSTVLRNLVGAKMNADVPRRPFLGRLISCMITLVLASCYSRLNVTEVCFLK